MHEFIEHVLPLYDVISFDIFDTFLLRPFLVPTDLFLAIGGPEFRNARTRAEGSAWGHFNRQITIDDIYELMPDDMRGMKEKELAEEKRRCVVNPYMLDVYNKAKELGKKVVFVSDMYLPENVIADILESKGVSGWDGLYVSCSRGCGKGDGSLLRAMTDDLGVNTQSVVHIGDNRGSDMGGGAKACMYTQYVRKISDTFFDENHMLATFFNQCDGWNNDRIRLLFGALVLATHLNKHKNGDDPWCRFGCAYSAVMYYSFTKWVLDVAKETGRTQLLLVLRDCYLVGKIIDAIARGTDYKYVYANRALLIPVLAGGLDADAAKSYKKYIDGIGIDYHNAILVEGTSSFRTTIRALGMMTCEEIPDIYFSLSREKYMRKTQSYLSGRRAQWFGIIELCGGSPSRPCIKLTDGEPELTGDNRYEKYREDGHIRRNDAAVSTAVLLNDTGIYLSGSEMVMFIQCCLDHTSAKDAEFFINQFGCEDPSHTAYRTVYWR